MSHRKCARDAADADAEVFVILILKLFLYQHNAVMFLMSKFLIPEFLVRNCG